MVDLSWCSILASLSKLFISSVHDKDIELVLSMLSTCVEMCGAVAMATPRDAFLQAICGEQMFITRLTSYLLIKGVC